MPMDLLSKAAMSGLGTLDFRLCLTKEFCFWRELGPTVTSATRSLWNGKRTLRKALSTAPKVLGKFQDRRRAAENRIELRRRLLAHTL